MFVGDIPRRSARKRVARMPTDGDNTLTHMMSAYLLSHGTERYAIEILAICHLYAAEIKAHNGRPITTTLEYIASACLVLPAKAIERVVLVPNEASFGLQTIKA